MTPDSGNVVVHWPGKSTVACPDHLRKLTGLASFMGFPLSYSPAPPEDVCENCKNEAAIRERGSTHD